jgi:ABC-type lipoprotein export system ATPase subunit
MHRDWHKTVVLVSHAPEAGQYASRMVRLKDGAILTD